MRGGVSDWDEAFKDNELSSPHAWGCFQRQVWEV